MQPFFQAQLTVMESLNFNDYPIPEWSDAQSIEAALDDIRHAHDEVSTNDAYDKLLWAVGNNHSGSFYPVVLAVLAPLQQVLESGSPWSQRAVMESLIDLGGSFAAEPGHEEHQGVNVSQQLRAFIASLRPTILKIAEQAQLGAQDAIDPARARSAADLLELIDDWA